MGRAETQATKKILDLLNEHGVAIKVHSDAYQGAGTPDILATINGRMVVIEVKRPRGGKTSLLQEWNLKKFREAGAVTGVCRTRAEAAALIGPLLDVSAFG